MARALWLFFCISLAILTTGGFSLMVQLRRKSAKSSQKRKTLTSSADKSTPKQEKSFLVSEPMQLLPFLIANVSGKGRNKVKSLLTHRQVSVNEKVMTRHDFPLTPGQTVSISASGALKTQEMLGLRILFEDDIILVVDKPSGLLSVATDEEKEKTAHQVLINYVKVRNSDARVYVVHRLDKDTSGVMMFAKTEEIQQSLQNSWTDVVQDRVYVTVVEGTVRETSGTIQKWIKESKTKTMFVTKPGDGVKAVTHYQVLKSNAEYSLLQVELDTGRKNQIRVHMQSLGHPIIGDRRYGSTKNPLRRLGLHARVLSFRHPVTQEIMKFETAIPTAFRKLFPSQTEQAKA
jgi:23S rRNA pseudouridine1911/1915/1917 synthase